MITLRADNRVLITNAKFAYLVENYASTQSEVQVSNSEPFAENRPILIGEIGQFDAEVKVAGDFGSDNVIPILDLEGAASSTAFAHPESTKVTAIPYSQIRFYWTEGSENPLDNENPEFDDSNPLTDWMDLDPSSYYTTFQDTDHTDGFGWFIYRDPLRDVESQVSNPIPYVGFTGNTAAMVFADFESLLNTNELKLVSINEKFAWLNEALAFLKNKLNLTEVEYTVSDIQYIDTNEGQAEYFLPDDFADVVEIVDIDNVEIEYISLNQVLGNNALFVNPQRTKYYLRGRYIGFTPTPTITLEGAYQYRYRAKASRVTSLSTYIDLPDNAFYALKDWMMFRAMSKFNNPMAQSYYVYWKNSVDLFMQASIKRSANLDTWGISASANV